MKKRVLIIDGNSFCYRAFYAIRSLATSKGQPTNAIYGFVTMLNKLIAEHKPNYLAVTFDLKGPTFRHKKFAEYKVHRKPMPEELSAQIPVVKEILQAYNIAIFEKKGYEADDIIATLVKQLSGEALDIMIVTADKDMLQVVSGNVKVINPNKDNLIIDEGWVKKRFGVTPDKIVEIMALAGDTSDNIPGVPGIGEATAIELIKRFGNLEEVLANTDKITNKSRAERIRNFSRQAQMSRELAKLDCNLHPLSQRKSLDLLAQLEKTEANKKILYEIFKELEFKSLMQQMAPENRAKIEAIFTSSEEEIKNYLKRITAGSEVALYLLGTHPDPMMAKITGIAFAREKERPLFFSFSQTHLSSLKALLEDRNIKKIGHNLKYAQVLLSNYGIGLQGADFDTMIASYLLEPARLKFELPDIVLEYLNYKLKDIDALGKEAELAQICCQNSQSILKLSQVLRKQLKQKKLSALFRNIEMPLIEILAEMEIEGVALDKNLLLNLSRNFESRLKSLTNDIHEACGSDFNINSPKQLSFVLFEKLKLPKIKRTKTGTSTDTEVLRKLAQLHPVASSLLEFREISKLKSTYLDGMLNFVHPRTGKVHTLFNQTGTATGRLSSSRPNLQNIPIKTELGKKIRQIFIPAQKDNLFLSADYSQIELRILAHLSDDENLITAFKKNLDIHAYTASLIFGVDSSKVTEQMRNAAKTVNFGIIYGMSAYGLSKDLGIEQNKAQEFIDAYFVRYAGVHSYIRHQIEKAKTQGFVTTLMNRRRYVPQIESANENIRQFAQRVAINAPVQGSASDLIKAAMVEIHRSLKEQKILAKMIIQVHDELVFSLSAEELTKLRMLIKEKMETVIKLKVPIKVTIKVGKNWLELK